jgi:anti-sigma factor RsiW
MSPQGQQQDRCRALLVQLSNYVDGDLSGPERRAVVAHLKRCPCCQSMADGLRHTVETCRKAKAARLPADVRARARARIAALLADEAGK